MGVLQDLKSKLDQSKKAFGKLTENALKVGNSAFTAIKDSANPNSERSLKVERSLASNPLLPTRGGIVPELAVRGVLPKPIQKFAEEPFKLSTASSSRAGALFPQIAKATDIVTTPGRVLLETAVNIPKGFLFGDVNQQRKLDEIRNRIMSGEKVSAEEFKSVRDAQKQNADMTFAGMTGNVESVAGKAAVEEAVKIAKGVRGSADDLLKAGNTVEARKLFRPMFKAIEDISNSKIPKEEMLSKLKTLKGALPDYFKSEAEVVIRTLGDTKPKVVTSPIINKARLALKSTAEKTLDDTIEKIKPELEALRGKPITHEEIIKAAKASKVLTKVIPRESIVLSEGSVLKTKQVMVNLSNEIDTLKRGGNNAAKVSELSKELADSLKVVASIKNSKGVGLEAERILVEGEPEMSKILRDIVGKLNAADKQIEDIVKASEKVDFNNIDEVTKFYRSYIQPSKWDILNEYRYVNILSNPRTHIGNALTNIIQATVRPVDKLASGGIDAISSALTGKQREMYISEVPEYIRGSLNSIPNAWSEAWKVFKGGAVERPDLIRIPTGKIPKWYTAPLRALEASDVFFRKIITDGEYESLVYRELRKNGGKELGENAVSMLKKQAEDVGRFYVFRGELGDASQGTAFRALDGFTLGVKKWADKSKIGKWAVPFFDTPVNILKQGIERTPGVGLVALPGATNKTEILGRQLVGSTIFMGAGYFAMTDRTTWTAPRGEKESAKFYAEGKQPYAIKIGDRWYQYNKIGPLGYPIAFAAAIKAKFQEDQDRQDKGEDPRGLLENITRSIMAMTSYFGDQSYVENVGDLMSVLFEGDYNKLERILANSITQFIPLDAFLGMVSRIVDDTYRHPENVADYIKSQLPFISGSIEPYYTPQGLPSQKQNALFNALSPISVTEEKSLGPMVKFAKPKLKAVSKPKLKTIKKAD